MKGDFTRTTFNPEKHFLRVLMQQGRVQLDADWNEQASILLHYLQTLASDLIGPYAGPVNAQGFAIKKGNNGDFTIGEGRYYVNGILCENERELNYFSQPDYPLNKEKDKLDNGHYIVYLDVWERHISFVVDDDIREKALNGADTATRSKVIWQVKTGPLEANVDNRLINCQAGIDELNNQLALSQVCMSARARQGKTDTKPCLTEPEARYRGAENQLYRVEIHDGNLDETGKIDQKAVPTVKFSRENGSVVFPIIKWTVEAATTLVELEHLGCDDKLGLAAKDWVEFIDDELDLHNRTQSLFQVLDTDVVNRTVTLSGMIDGGKGDSHPFLRRWDQTQANKINEHGVMTLTTGDWIPLEESIEVKFSNIDAGVPVRRGDYWLIPARQVTGDVEWPKVTDENGEVIRNEENMPIPKFLRPQGIIHHYAPLAVITVQNGEISGNETDCRCSFQSQSFTCENNKDGRLGIGNDFICPEEQSIEK